MVCLFMASYLCSTVTVFLKPSLFSKSYAFLKPTNFTLIFSSLPKNCKVFDFSEEINDPYKFVVRNIPRNKSDVYTININF